MSNLLVRYAIGYVLVDSTSTTIHSTSERTGVTVDLLPVRWRACPNSVKSILTRPIQCLSVLYQQHSSSSPRQRNSECSMSQSLDNVECQFLIQWSLKAGALHRWNLFFGNFIPRMRIASFMTEQDWQPLCSSQTVHNTAILVPEHRLSVYSGCQVTRESGQCTEMRMFRAMRRTLIVLWNPVELWTSFTKVLFALDRRLQ